MIINKDCRYFKGIMPCHFHKADGRLCEDCLDYDKIDFKILIIKLGALGDVLRTTTILIPLKKLYPNSHITWITKSNAKPLLKNNELIDRLLYIDSNYLEYLLNEEFDIGICLDVENLSATILNLTNAKSKYGFICDKLGRVVPVNNLATEWWLMSLNDELKRQNRKTYYQHMYQICSLNKPISKPIIKVDDSSKLFAEHFREQYNLTKYKKILGINTGGGLRWQLKKWTKEGYIELINKLHIKLPEVGLLLFGGPEEKDFNEEIKRRLNIPIIDTGTNNSLEDFIALVNLTDVFFTPDSLGMHIAIALNKDVIVIVGPTSPWELDVFGKGEIIYSSIDCISCYLEKCSKVVNCMNSLDVNYILEKISQYL